MTSFRINIVAQLKSNNIYPYSNRKLYLFPSQALDEDLQKVERMRRELTRRSIPLPTKNK